ncbi:DUF2029 domain-containing protein [Lentibacter algarum]|uniref:glycosyltransferase family 87 protein n=1 Tax=Lentibacter algarum TaxID=576131 RepID=UPI001C0767C1|nr:glycosyltransferase family 87 protein [Lentibacter algarum]MBU2981330.1 DUF2029 domain-containing protein [Lentibacter algarum]
MNVSPTLQRYLYPLVALAWIIVLVATYWQTPSVDLTAVYVAGVAAAKGMPEAIFAIQPDFLGPGPGPAVVEGIKAELGLVGHPTVPYIYPPIWAWVIAPITQLVSQPVFSKAVLVLHCLMLAATVGLTWRIVRPPKMSFQTWVFLGFLVLFTSTPAHHAIVYNQPQITTIFLVALAFERYRSGFFILAGGILAVAAALKLSPVLLALIFLLDRNWRALGGFVVVGGVLGLSSIAIAGWPMHLEFLALLSKINKLVILQSVNNSPEMIIFQIASLLQGKEVFWEAMQTVTHPEPFWLSSLMALVKLMALASLILMRPRLVPGTAVPVLLLGFSLATALFGPVSWSHSFLLPLLLMPTLFHLVSRRSAWVLIITILLLQCSPAYVVYVSLSSALYVTSLIGVLCYLGLLIVLVATVLRAVRFEPEVPLHYRK